MKVLWEAVTPSGKARVRLEEDEKGMWITVVTPPLWGDERDESSSVQVTEKDLTRLSFVLTAQQ